MLQEANKDFVVGVIALQGGFAEHISSLTHLNVKSCEVRNQSQAEKCSAFIIPGGESTVIWKLMRPGLSGYIKKCVIDYKIAIWGTCAGAILCSRKYLNVVDVDVIRNAYGSQLSSVVTEINSSETKKPLGRAVLIRAPKFVNQNDKVKTIASSNSGEILALSQGRCLATSFHPELIENSCFNWHEFFC
jgi:5'-phosphate synthase pdxT subunit